jgi:hypothetical protein
MAAVAGPSSRAPSTTPSPWIASGLHRFSVAELDELVENGTIAEDERVELMSAVVYPI